MVNAEGEAAVIEEHLLWCALCMEAAEEAAEYVDRIRKVIIHGNFDLQ
jgi:hypothetical protein